jgi:hypothetical protein
VWFYPGLLPGAYIDWRTYSVAQALHAIGTSLHQIVASAIPGTAQQMHAGWVLIPHMF